MTVLGIGLPVLSSATRPAMSFYKITVGDTYGHKQKELTEVEELFMDEKNAGLTRYFNL